MPPLEQFLSVPIQTLVRFGQWDEVLDEPKPDPEFHLQTALYHYARARAYAANGSMRRARAEQALLKGFVNDPAFEKHKAFGVPAKQIVDVAERVVAGDIARREGKYDEAIAAFQEAAKLYDTMPYTEPPYWDYPVRHTLGATLLAAGQPAEAEKAYREDLAYWPNNGWSLLGLQQALEAQGKTAEAASVKAEFEKAWSRADVKLAASSF